MTITPTTNSTGNLTGYKATEEIKNRHNTTIFSVSCYGTTHARAINNVIKALTQS